MSDKRGSTVHVHCRIRTHSIDDHFPFKISFLLPGEAELGMRMRAVKCVWVLQCRGVYHSIVQQAKFLRDFLVAKDCHGRETKRIWNDS